MKERHRLQIWIIVLSSFVLFAKSLDDNHYNERFCDSHTQTDIALAMFNHSSPKGSSSYEKLYEVVSFFDYFYPDYLGGIGSDKIFEDVAENLSEMLESYGLEKSHDFGQPRTIFLGSLFMNENGRALIKRRDVAVLLLQTEQLCCTTYLQEEWITNLQACEKSPNCVILEYSDHNYRWMTDELGISSSVVLLPTLLQGRLDSYYRRHHLPGVWERTADVAFFGMLTPRRQQILRLIGDPNPNNPSWNMILEENNDKVQIVHTYLTSKICLTVHSYEADSPGEYHRLSEVGVSGCIPVMESFGDRIGLDIYKICGGLVLSDIDKMPYVIAELIKESADDAYFDTRMRRRVNWWKNRVEWKGLLEKLFHEENQRTKQEL